LTILNHLRRELLKKYNLNEGIRIIISICSNTRRVAGSSKTIMAGILADDKNCEPIYSSDTLKNFKQSSLVLKHCPDVELAPSSWYRFYLHR
jgi:hypothetical protein